jgi:hypothetical protein
MKIASDINTRQELEEMKSVMEIYVISNRIKELINSE